MNDNEPKPDPPEIELTSNEVVSCLWCAGKPQVIIAFPAMLFVAHYLRNGSRDFRNGMFWTAVFVWYGSLVLAWVLTDYSVTGATKSKSLFRGFFAPRKNPDDVTPFAVCMTVCIAFSPAIFWSLVEGLGVIFGAPTFLLLDLILVVVVMAYQGGFRTFAERKRAKAAPSTSEGDKSHGK